MCRFIQSRPLNSTIFPHHPAMQTVCWTGNEYADMVDAKHEHAWLCIISLWLWPISRQSACARWTFYCFSSGNGGFLANGHVQDIIVFPSAMVVSSRYCVPRFACYRQTIAWIFWTWKRVGRQPSGWWCAFFVSFQSFRWSLDTYKPHKFEETEGIASWSSKVHKEGCGDNNALMLGLVGYHFKDKPNKVYTMLQDPNSTCS